MMVIAAHPVAMMAHTDADMDIGGAGGRGAQHGQGKYSHNQSLHAILLRGIFPAMLGTQQFCNRGVPLHSINSIALERRMNGFAAW
jgi:hypothetical protein